jgi:4a-hydroxytetrahydrobiopterin dehydratase
MELAEKKCIPCEGNTPRIEGDATSHYLKKISKGWYLFESKEIRRKFKLKDFRQNIAFVNGIAELAEDQGHHPDMCLYWNILEVSFWTHAIGGLSENDFIMAAKVDDLYEGSFNNPAEGQND